MIRGLFGGIFWGVVLGVVLLLMASLLMPLPQGNAGGPEVGDMVASLEPAAVAVAEPAAAEIAPATVTPETSANQAEAVAEAPPVVDAPAEVVVTLTTEMLTPPTETSPSEALVAVDGAATSSAALAVPAAPAAPELAPAADIALSAPPPVPEPAPDVAAQPVQPAALVEALAEAAPPAPETVAVDVAEVAVIEPPTPESAPAEVSATPDPEVLPLLPEREVTQGQTGTGPEVATDAPAGIGQPAGTIGQPATTGFDNLATSVRVNRLPRVVESAEAEAPLDVTATASEIPVGDAVTFRALERHAVLFDNPDTKPLLSVIVLDIGAAQGGLDRAALSTFPFPVTFAVPANRADAELAAETYRSKGFEVILVTAGLPVMASPSDIEVAFEVFRGKVPEAVAVMDAPEGGFQGNRVQAAQMVAILKDGGYGLIGMDRGLNNAMQVAEREGVPSASVFRDLDADAGDAASIRRTMDRAAFRAAQEGSVIILAQSKPETISALFAWALEGRAEGVALAPVSQVLLGQ